MMTWLEARSSTAKRLRAMKTAEAEKPRRASAATCAGEGQVGVTQGGQQRMRTG